MLKDAGYGFEPVNPIEYLQSNFPGRPIFRYIQSHADLDHMRGLAALLATGIPIVNFWDTCHDKTPDFQSDADRQDWNAYQKLAGGKTGATVLRLTADQIGKYYNQDDFGSQGDGIYVLSPTAELSRKCSQNGNTNNGSYVLMLIAHGNRVILGGDAEEEAWTEIYARYAQYLPCLALKASHHGRDSGYHQPAVRAMSPTYIIASVGQQPETDACCKYRSYSQNVWTTRWRGNLVLTIHDNGQHQWTDQRLFMQVLAAFSSR